MMRELLEQAGFRVRGKRADCVHCQGTSRFTVAFNDSVAFCHRCKWTTYWNEPAYSFRWAYVRNSANLDTSAHPLSAPRECRADSALVWPETFRRSSRRTNPQIRDDTVRSTSIS